MASDQPSDDDLSPQDFLRRVRAMTEERDREDRQRVTEIEKDIMQSREQRRARRADVARSLSNAPVGLEKVLSPTATPSANTPQASVDRDSTSPTRAEGSSLNQSNTLSWQQRRRPLSQIALENNHLQNHTSPEPSPASPEKELSRADITHSLAAKDPSWFRQTADRGVGSVALRRTPEPESTIAQDVHLPGLGRDSHNLHRSHSPDGSRAEISPRDDLRHTDNDRSRPHSIVVSREDDVSISSRPLSLKPSPLNSPRLVPGNSSSGRTSPTKGMGGFVQSAMMKRSDSVNKRWSTAPTPGLQRAGSTASDRPNYMGRTDSVKTRAGVDTISKQNGNNRLSGLSNLNPLETTSRPSSTHNANTTADKIDDVPESTAERIESLTKSGVDELHGRPKSVASIRASTPILDEATVAASPPLSPSKRWSPTKSSWLESKLSQPDEKPKATPPPAQPSWMADLAKAKQQRGSTTIQSANADSDTKVSALASSSLSSKEREAPNKDVPPLRTRTLSNARSPPTGPKPVISKPQDAGKIDFRANLKSRAPPPGPKPSNQPEFQSRFGSLRKAETKNYVAPDELKNNILRGMAGLSQSGGPAKRERVDELKESLLKKKEEMKSKASSEARVPIAPKESTAPEALLRRQQMKADPPKPSSSKPEIATKSVDTAVETGFAASSDRGAVPLLSQTSSAASKTIGCPGLSLNDRQIGNETAAIQPPGNTRLANKLNPGLASLLARGPPGLGSAPSRATAAAVSAAPTDEVPTQSRELTHMTKGRARGPKRRAPKGENKPESSISTNAALDVPVHLFRLSDLSLEATSPGAENLSFATPTAPITSSEAKPPVVASSPKVVNPGAALGLPSNPKINIKKETSSSNVYNTESPSIANVATSGTHAIQPETISTGPKPRANDTQASPTKLAALKFSGFNFGLDAFEIENGSALPSPEPTKLEHPRAQTPTRQMTNLTHLDLRTPASQPDSPASPLRSPGRISVREAVAREVKTSYVVPPDFQKPASQPASPTRSPVAVSVKDAASKWNTNSAKVTSSRVKSPIRLLKQEDEDKAMLEAGLRSESKAEARPAKPPIDLGISMASQHDAKAGAIQPPKLTISPAVVTDLKEQNQQPSPIKRSRPPSMTIRVPPPDSPSSPIPQTSEAVRMFSEIFDDQPRISGSTEIDVLTVINNYPVNTEKIETIKSQMQELSEDGNLTPMPPGREHILFEDAMYVCVHIFKNARGARNTDVYFWTGHNVQAADAQMYARNIARANTGRFVPVQQGKEPPAFFQALGGILITFRGSRVKKRESTGLPEKFILCGRKHLGHIAFDEVDFARTSFCSGFPYLISQIKDLYLWRGAGASADELGCARLIAMDIGLTPDVTEIIEGQEPAKFLNMFPANPNSKVRSPGIPPSATHWRLKASIGDKYRARLFRITQENVTTRKNTFQVSSFFGGLASTAAAHLRTSSITPSTPALPSPASTLQSPFTESSFSDKKSLSILASSQNTPRSAEMPSEVACNVDEIVPFCREDLQGEGVWILDAFFEVYIILSPLSNTQNHAFSAALLFAQDYVILAASVEDRPFIPVSTVVVEGAPKDMRAVFRRWTDQPASGNGSVTSLPTSKLMAGKPLKRGGSMRTVGLAAALAAVQR